MQREEPAGYWGNGRGGRGLGTNRQMVYNAFTARAIFDGKRTRKAIQRRTIDYNSSIFRNLEVKYI